MFISRIVPVGRMDVADWGDPAVVVSDTSVSRPEAREPVVDVAGEDSSFLGTVVLGDVEQGVLGGENG